MGEVRREGGRFTDGEHGVSVLLGDVQIKTLLNEADGGWAAFYQAVLAHRKAEAKPCAKPGHASLPKCSCPVYEATLEAGA